jgi:hypothetical protein
MQTQRNSAPREIRWLDRVIRETLTEFSEDLDGRWWGKEHDLVNRYAHGFLMARCSPKGPLKHPTQIGIEVGVAQPIGFSSKAARKDLVIWPKPWMSCWDDKYDPANHPMAVLEWKIKLNARNLRCDAHDADWLSRFARSQPDFVGYSVTMNRTRSAAQKMCVTRFRGQAAEDNWLVL